MGLEGLLIGPLILAVLLARGAGRRDPERRARKEAAWRDQIIAAGLRER